MCSGGYINGRNSANLELLIDKTSSIYLYVKWKALASWIFLSFTSFWRNSDSDEYKNKSARRGQLIRYARASSNYSDFLKRHLYRRNRLLDQGYEKIRLIRSLKKFIFRYQDLVEIYSVSTAKCDKCNTVYKCHVLSYKMWQM
jgi:hypothetical protein